MAAAYYPVQKVTLPSSTGGSTGGSGAVTNVQSCSLDFSASRTPIYTFGQLLAKGTIVTELPSCSVNIVAAILDTNPLKSVYSSLEAVISAKGGNLTIDTGGGTFTISNAILNGLGANASVGEVPTANVTFIGTQVSFSASNSQSQTINVGQASSSSIIKNEDIKINGQTNGKSFSFSVNIDRQAVLPLGINIDSGSSSSTSSTIDWIIKGIKGRAEAEIFAGITSSNSGGGSNSATLGSEGSIVLTAKSENIGLKSMKVNVAKTNLSTDGAATYTLGIDGDITNSTQIAWSSS